MIHANPTMPETGVDSSVDLLLRAQAGDDDALNRLLTRYRPRLQKFARGRLPWGHRTMVESADLVQDAVISALPHLATLEVRTDRAFENYLKEVVKNRIKDLNKRHRRRPVRADMPRDLVADAASPEDLAVQADERDRYRRAFPRLKEKERKAIQMRLERCLPYEKVAIELGWRSADAARMAVSRAITKLADIMAREAGQRRHS